MQIVACRDGLSDNFYNYCVSPEFRVIFDPDCTELVRLPLYTSLMELDLASCITHDPRSRTTGWNSMCFTPTPLKALNLSHNPAIFFSDSSYQSNLNGLHIDIENRIDVFDFSFNRVEVFNLTALKVGKHARKLIIGGNRFHNNSLRDVCRFVPNVTSLSLTDSGIQSLSETRLDLCEKLKYLDLSSNQLRILSGKFLHKNARISTLSVANNHIVLIEKDALFALTRSLRHGFIDLSNNRLLCVCHSGTLDTITALQTGDLNAVLLDDMTCYDKKADDLIFIAKVNVKKLQKECFPSYAIYLIYGIMSCFLTLVITASLRFLYSKRYYLKTC